VSKASPRSARERARDAREAAYRDAVVDAAERLFAERGVDATKMDDVAAEVGISIATLYTVFRGKADVVDNVHRTRLAALTLPSVEAAERSGPADIRLREALRQGIALHLEHPLYVRMLLREGFAWGLRSAISAQSREGAGFYTEGVGGALARIIQQGIQQGTEQGVFETGSAERSARAVVMLQQLHLADWLDGDERETAEEVFARYWSDIERLLARRR